MALLSSYNLCFGFEIRTYIFLITQASPNPEYDSYKRKVQPLLQPLSVVSHLGLLCLLMYQFIGFQIRKEPSQESVNFRSQKVRKGILYILFQLTNSLKTQ